MYHPYSSAASYIYANADDDDDDDDDSEPPPPLPVSIHVPVHIQGRVDRSQTHKSNSSRQTQTSTSTGSHPYSSRTSTVVSSPRSFASSLTYLPPSSGTGGGGRWSQDSTSGWSTSVKTNKKADSRGYGVGYAYDAYSPPESTVIRPRQRASSNPRSTTILPLRGAGGGPISHPYQQQAAQPPHPQAAPEPEVEVEEPSEWWPDSPSPTPHSAGYDFGRESSLYPYGERDRDDEGEVVGAVGVSRRSTESRKGTTALAAGATTTSKPQLTMTLPVGGGPTITQAGKRQSLSVAAQSHGPTPAAPLAAGPNSKPQNTTHPLAANTKSTSESDADRDFLNVSSSLSALGTTSQSQRSHSQSQRSLSPNAASTGTGSASGSRSHSPHIASLAGSRSASASGHGHAHSASATGSLEYPAPLEYLDTGSATGHVTGQRGGGGSQQSHSHSHSNSHSNSQQSTGKVLPAVPAPISILNNPSGSNSNVGPSQSKTSFVIPPAPTSPAPVPTPTSAPTPVPVQRFRMTPYGNAADPFSLRRSAFVPYAFEHERDAAHAAQLQGRRLVRSASVNSGTGSLRGKKGVMGRLSSCMADCAADVEDSFREGEGDAAWGERERGVGVGFGPGVGAGGNGNANGMGRATGTNVRASRVYMYEPEGRRP